MVKTLRPFLCCLLCCLLIEVPQLRSQQAPAPEPPQTQASGLKLSVLEGEGATNFIRKQLGTAPVVQVFDAQGDPLAGAEVTFAAPLRGPSVTFFGANAQTTVRTDPEGRAQSPSTLPNTYEGDFTIDVSARYQGSTASAEIHQKNLESETAPKKRHWLRGWGLVGVVVVATVVIVAIGLRAGND